ncbi:hypothetical protein B0H11DRAFT_1922978 [Mycena galericulata]|nr:hypothetical protein B0H11DRAFT_1922978 [Mycena galericulata]
MQSPMSVQAGAPIQHRVEMEAPVRPQPQFYWDAFLICFPTRLHGDPSSCIRVKVPAQRTRWANWRASPPESWQEQKIKKTTQFGGNPAWTFSLWPGPESNGEPPMDTPHFRRKCTSGGALRMQVDCGTCRHVYAEKNVSSIEKQAPRSNNRRKRALFADLCAKPIHLEAASNEDSIARIFTALVASAVDGISRRTVSEIIDHGKTSIESQFLPQIPSRV